jgi:hypothetical protein
MPGQRLIAKLPFRGRPLLCPVCGFQMEKELFRREGFNCPNCGSFLHLAESTIQIAAAASIPLAALISYVVGLSGLVFFLVTVVLAILLFVLACVAIACYFPKLASGLPPYGRVILHIPSSDDPPKDEKPPSSR